MSNSLLLICFIAIDEYVRPSSRDVEAIGESPSTKMVTKAVTEDDLDEAINNTDASIPISSESENDQEFTSIKNQKKYFEHGVTLCVIVASVTLVRTNKLTGSVVFIHSTVKIYFYFRQRDMVLILIVHWR